MIEIDRYWVKGFYFAHDKPAFRPNQVWKPPKVHASFEVFLSKVVKEFFAYIGMILHKIIFLLKNGKSNEVWQVIKIFA